VDPVGLAVPHALGVGPTKIVPLIDVELPRPSPSLLVANDCVTFDMPSQLSQKPTVSATTTPFAFTWKYTCQSLNALLSALENATVVVWAFTETTSMQYEPLHARLGENEYLPEHATQTLFEHVCVLGLHEPQLQPL
jgi:hypothetical protein